MKAYWGSGGIAPHIFYLGTGWRWVVSSTPLLLYLHGKSLWYPLDRKLCGPQRQSGRSGEEKISQSLPRLEPRIIQPVAQRYTTEASLSKKTGQFFFTVCAVSHDSIFLRNIIKFSLGTENGYAYFALMFLLFTILWHCHVSVHCMW
jgi:hypothetical protein